jgi:integrase
VAEPAPESSSETGVFESEADLCNGESEHVNNSAGANLMCPHCRSRKLWRNGYRYTPFDDKIQRWLCCNCGRRFSDPQDVEKAWSTLEHLERVESKSLKSRDDKDNISQICVTETKNLAAEQQTTEVPRKTDLKSAIVNFLWHLKKANYSPDTIRAYGFNLQQLVKLGVDLYNPESFIETMANQANLTQTRKYSLRKAYTSFLNANKIEAELPTYRITRPIPYIPPEEYIDQLIASCGVQMAAFLTTLKQTGARPGEVWRLKWTDIDIGGKKIHISQPEKGCNARIRPIDAKLLNMLLQLPRKQERIFTYGSRDLVWKSFSRMRQRAIHKLGNPELRKIDFYTFRYWRATIEYRRLHDFGAVMILLGHKSLKYVLLYAQLSDAYDPNGGYVCKEAFTRQEAKQLIEDGFEYVMEKEGVSLFRKLK